ncbi:MAG: hypothetical protein ACLTSX_01480 [Collinsella sp.]
MGTGTAQVDCGNFEAVVAGERLALKLLVVSLPHSNARYARVCMSQRSECMCRGSLADLRAGRRAPAALASTTPPRRAGCRARGGDGVPPVLPVPRAHYGCASCYCNPYSGNEKGSVENAVGFIRETCSSPCRRSGPSRS